MRKIRYSKDEDALLIELSDKQIDYAEEEGHRVGWVEERNPTLYKILTT